MRSFGRHRVFFITCHIGCRTEHCIALCEIWDAIYYIMRLCIDFRPWFNHIFSMCAVCNLQCACASKSKYGVLITHWTKETEQKKVSKSKKEDKKLENSNRFRKNHQTIQKRLQLRGIDALVGVWSEHWTKQQQQ